MVNSPQVYNVVFDYSGAPTLRRFRDSRKRIRYIIGPFGSGKSSACVMDIYRKACEQAPDSRKLRRTRWAVVRNCYDDQTEILTERRGWQLFKNLFPEDRVATLQNEKIVYERPDGVSVSPYKGEMIGFESEGVDFLVTPDHEMWVSKRRTRKKVWGEFETIHAEDVYGHYLYRVRKDAEWDGEDIHLSEDVFEWLGFWFAEGSFGVYEGRDRCVITQTLPDGIEYAEELFARASIPFTVWDRGDGHGVNLVLENNDDLSGRILKIVRLAGKAGTKSVPRLLLKAPRKYLRAFLYGFTKGDGHIRKEGTTTLYTSSKQLADDLQEIALKAGWAATISSRNRVGKEVKIGSAKGKVNYPEYTVTLLCSKKYRPILHVDSKNTNHLRGWYKQQYDGMVYCAEMKIPTVFVRRNGKAFWCNRTYPELKDTTIKTFMDWFPDQYFGHYRATPTPDYNIIQTLADGTTVECEVLFRALDKPEHVKNLLSLDVTGAWFNEVREIPKAIFDAMDGRINRYPSMKDGGATWCGIFMDTNPCDTDHWLYTLFEEKVPKDPELQDLYEKFHQPSGRSAQAENLSHLPPNYYKTMAVGKGADWIRVYIDGQYGYVREGKIIYTNYFDALHCSPIPLEPWRGIHLTLGWDFGLTPSCVVDQYHPKGKLQTIKEFCASEMGVKKLARDVVRPYLLANFQGFGIVSGCDPAGAQRSQIDETRSCYKELKECGFPVKLAYSNALEPRFTAVDNFLTATVEGKPAYQLDPGCTLMRKGFNGEYKRRRLNISGSEIYSEEPEKNAVSHPHEAHQYACMTIQRGIVPTSNIPFGSDHQPAKQPPRKAFA